MVPPHRLGGGLSGCIGSTWKRDRTGAEPALATPRTPLGSHRLWVPQFTGPFTTQSPDFPLFEPSAILRITFWQNPDDLPVPAAGRSRAF